MYVSLNYFGSRYWIQCLKSFENLIKKQNKKSAPKHLQKTQTNPKQKKKPKQHKEVIQEVVLIPVFQVLEQPQGNRSECPGMLDVFSGWV